MFEIFQKEIFPQQFDKIVSGCMKDSLVKPEWNICDHQVIDLIGQCINLNEDISVIMLRIKIIFYVHQQELYHLGKIVLVN